MTDELSILRDSVSRIMVPVLWCHVLLTVLVARLAGNGWLLPGIISVGIVGAATAAWLYAPSSATTRLTIAVALVGMISIILAACHGSPLQIDVHMYYFAGLAVLAAYCDRNVILAGAAVIAVQHITMNFLMPALIFPGGADFRRVLLHAGIVIVEAGALVWMTQRIVKLFSDSQRHLAEAHAASKVVAELAEKAEMERNTVDAERRVAEGERESAAKSQAFVVTSVATGLGRLADRDLLARLAEPFSPEYENLRNDFNRAMDTLQATMQSIATNTQGVRSGAGEITQASDDLSRRTEQQAASLEETAAALDEITTTVRRTAESAGTAREVAKNAKADAERSGDVVSQTVDAMNAIETSSGQIVSIIGVIDEIAFQTNLLALNAGIEAARAGDAGRGFAVVATEVRALAQRSAEAAKEIKNLITTSSGHVIDGVKLVGETGRSLSRIVENVTRLNHLVSEIAGSAQEQASGLAELNIAVNQMDRVTQQNAAMVEQSTAASHGLTNEAQALAELVAQFQVSDKEAASNSQHPANSVQRSPAKLVLIGAAG